MLSVERQRCSVHALMLAGRLLLTICVYEYACALNTLTSCGGTTAIHGDRCKTQDRRVCVLCCMLLLVCCRLSGAHIRSWSHPTPPHTSAAARWQRWQQQCRQQRWEAASGFALQGDCCWQQLCAQLPSVFAAYALTVEGKGNTAAGSSCVFMHTRVLLQHMFWCQREAAQAAPPPLTEVLQ